MKTDKNINMSIKDCRKANNINIDDLETINIDSSEIVGAVIPTVPELICLKILNKLNLLNKENIDII